MQHSVALPLVRRLQRCKLATSSAWKAIGLPHGFLPDVLGFLLYNEHNRRLCFIFPEVILEQIIVLKV